MRFFRLFLNRRFLQAGLLLTGALFLVLGLLRGESQTVLTKAIYICLECIGIG